MYTYLQLTTIFALCLCTAMASIATGKGKSDLNLMQFMMRSRELTQQHPQRSMECFDYYIPVLNSITNDYEKGFALCLNTEASDRALVDHETKPQRDELEEASTNSCQLLNACQHHNSSVDYFDCYANAGSVNSKIMYLISTNASETLGVVQEKYHIIENNLDICTNVSKRKYVEDTANTYEEMQNCLQGKSPVPSTSDKPPVTTTPEVPTTSSTSESTAAPIEETTSSEVPRPTEEPPADRSLRRSARSLSAESWSKRT